MITSEAAVNGTIIGYPTLALLSAKGYRRALSRHGAFCADHRYSADELYYVRHREDEVGPTDCVQYSNSVCYSQYRTFILR